MNLKNNIIERKKIRLHKLSELIRRELSSILLKKFFYNDVIIYNAVLSSDMQYCKIFFNTISDKKEQAKDLLQNNSYILSKEIMNNIRIRKPIKLKFIFKKEQPQPINIF